MSRGAIPLLSLLFSISPFLPLLSLFLGGSLAQIIPSATNPCPTFTNGDVSFVVGSNNRTVRVWTSDLSGGALVLYWHGTGNNPSEVQRGLGDSLIAQILAEGGMIVAPTSGIKDLIPWALSDPLDLFLTDEIVACAVQQNRVNSSRIHSVGYSAGGLASGRLSIERSDYIASVAMYSGGIAPLHSYSFQSSPSTSTVSALAFYGGPGDFAFISFETASWEYLKVMKAHSNNHFVHLCNHNKNHTIPEEDTQSVWTFLKDHPFGVISPYFSSGLPSTFPEYCKTTSQTPPEATPFPTSNPLGCQEGAYYSFREKQCFSCPAHSTSPSGSTSLSSCVCLPGYTGPNGSNCTACPLRTYKSETGDGECIPCLPMSYSYEASTSAESCLCMGGYTGANGEQCVACLVGTYKNSGGSAPCTPCPDHMTSPAASYSLSQCSCESGYLGISDTKCFRSGYVAVVFFVPLIAIIAMSIGLHLFLKRKKFLTIKRRQQADFARMFEGPEDFEEHDLDDHFAAPVSPTSPTSPSKN